MILWRQWRESALDAANVRRSSAWVIHSRRFACESRPGLHCMLSHTDTLAFALTVRHPAARYDLLMREGA